MFVRFLVLFILTAHLAQAQSIIYVTPGGNGNRSGSSWANALPGSQLQTQLLYSGPQAEFWVAAGFYLPTSVFSYDQTVSFSIPAGVKVYGGFVGTETSLSERPTTVPSSSTLSGNIGDPATATDNCFHVVRMNYATDQTLLDGFVVVDGFANGFTSNNDIAHGSGAGLYVNGKYSRRSSTPTIANCWFERNRANSNGGVVFNDASIAGRVSLTVKGCVFVKNQGYSGGAIAGEGDVTFVVSESRFTSNTAVFSGGAIHGVNSNCTLTNCAFTDNRAGVWGGGFYNDIGGGTSKVRMTNCLFAYNSARYEGGGVLTRINNSSTTLDMELTNSTWWGNSATIDNKGAAIANLYLDDAEATGVRIGIRNCIVSGNTTGIKNTQPNALTLTYSNVQGIVDNPFDPRGNRNVNPRFVNSPMGDFRLMSDSPLIDAGDPSIPFFVVTDLAGNARLSNGRIDMGAYEFQSNNCVGPIYSIRAGQWTDPTIWSCGRVPLATEAVQVRHLITIPTGFRAIAGQIVCFEGAMVRFEPNATLLTSP